MSTEYPMTAGVRFLRQKGIAFTGHLYRYEEHGGAPRAAEELGVPLHAVVKTLVMETETRAPLLVLMHGDLEVSTKRLAREIGAKQVIPCSPEAASRHTGYTVGGISPFGTRRTMPIYVQASILDLDRVYINGGKRGFLMGIPPEDIGRALEIHSVEVGIPPH
jgi:Cys-tRNA(Pro) deacylase